MSRRKDAKALARWDDEARGWATDRGRGLALDLYYNRETASQPYGVGVVLDAGEKMWAEVPVRFNLDWPTLVKPGEQDPLAMIEHPGLAPLRVSIDTSLGGPKPPTPASIEAPAPSFWPKV